MPKWRVRIYASSHNSTQEKALILIAFEFSEKKWSKTIFSNIFWYYIQSTDADFWSFFSFLNHLDSRNLDKIGFSVWHTIFFRNKILKWTIKGVVVCLKENPEFFPKIKK